MKVILTQTVPNIGKEGTVVSVADGYARNYLFPKKLAIVAEKNQVAALAKRNERVAAKQADTKTAAVALGEKLSGANVRIAGKVGAEKGKLFGAITNADVAEAIKTQLGTDLEKKQIGLIDPIRKLGSYVVVIDLHRDVDAKITVEVFDPSAPVVKEVAPIEEPVLA